MCRFQWVKAIFTTPSALFLPIALGMVIGSMSGKGEAPRPMKPMRRLLLAFLALAGVGFIVVLGWQLAKPSVAEYARRRAVDELARVFASEARVRRVAFRFVPPRLELDELEIGSRAEILRIGKAVLRLLPFASVLQRRPVFDLEADGVFVDVTKLPAGKKKEQEEGQGRGNAMEKVPALRLRRARLGNARVLLPGGDAPFEVGAGALELRVGTRPGGRLAGRARVEGLRVGRAGETLELGELRLTLVRTAVGFRVDLLRLEAPAIRIAASNESRAPLRHAVKVDADLAQLARLDPVLAGLAGKLEIEAKLDGRLEDPAASAELRARGLAWRGENLDALEANLAWQGGRAEVRSARALGYGGEIALTGSISPAGAKPFELRGEWKSVDVRRVVAAGGASISRAVTTSGKVSADGALEPLAVAASGSGRFTTDTGVDIDWDGKGRATRAEHAIQLNATEGTANVLHADVSAGAGRRLEGKVDVELGDTTRLGPLLGAGELPPMAGRLTAAARLSGTTEQPELSGNVAGRDVGALGVRFTRIDGSFRVDRERFESAGIEIGVGQGMARASGTIGLAPGVANAWQAEIRDVAVTEAGAIARALGRDQQDTIRVLMDTLPLTAGSLSATGRGSGPWSAATVKADATIDGLGIGEERFERLQVAAGATFPRWNAALELVHLDDERLSARLSGDAARTLAAEIDSTRWSLGGFGVARRTRLSGEVSLQARLAGPPAALDGNATAVLRALRWNERTLGDTTIHAEARRGEWSLGGALLDGALRAQARVVPGGTFAIDAELADAHLAPVLSEDPTLIVDASGSLHLAGRFDAPRRLGGEVELSRLLIATGSFRAEAPETIRIAARDGVFAIESFHLQGSGTELNVTGTADTSGAVKLSARGNGSLQLLEALGRPIESMRGAFTLELDLQAAPGTAPELAGSLELSDAALDVGLTFGPTETNALLRFEHSAVRIERLDGRLGGGTFTLGGSLDLAAGPALTWKIVEVSTGLVPSLEHEISGAGTLDGTWDELELGGELDIVRALYDRRIEIRDFLPSFRRELAKAPDEDETAPQRVLRLDLHAVAPDELFIDNNFARIEAQADLRVSGVSERPQLAGRIQVISGEVYFRKRTFEVRTAVLDFRPELGLEGFLNVIAESEIQTPEATYSVVLQVTGRTDDPRVVMSADDPSLTQNDIVSLIAFGRTAAQLQKEGGGVGVGDLLQLAPGGGYAEKVQRGTAKLLRVDRFEIEPAFSRTTGEFEPQLSVGKNFTEDLSATLASTFGVASRQVLELGYRVTPRISLLGGWESESQNQGSAFSAGARFRFAFRDTPGFSLLHGPGARGSHAR